MPLALVSVTTAARYKKKKREGEEKKLVTLLCKWMISFRCNDDGGLWQKKYRVLLTNLCFVVWANISKSISSLMRWKELRWNILEEGDDHKLRNAFWIRSVTSTPFPWKRYETYARTSILQTAFDLRDRNSVFFSSNNHLQTEWKQFLFPEDFHSFILCLETLRT